MRKKPKIFQKYSKAPRTVCRVWVASQEIHGSPKHLRSQKMNAPISRHCWFYFIEFSMKFVSTSIWNTPPTWQRPVFHSAGGDIHSEAGLLRIVSLPLECGLILLRSLGAEIRWSPDKFMAGWRKAPEQNEATVFIVDVAGSLNSDHPAAEPTGLCLYIGVAALFRDKNGVFEIQVCMVTMGISSWRTQSNSQYDHGCQEVTGLRFRLTPLAKYFSAFSPPMDRWRALLLTDLFAKRERRKAMACLSTASALTTDYQLKSVLWHKHWST